MRVLGAQPARGARRIGALVVGVVLAGGVLAGCGGGSDAAATSSSSVDPDLGKETTDAEIPLLAPGDSKTIEFTATAPGDHPFECSFHVQLGQTGTMTVSG